MPIRAQKSNDLNRRKMSDAKFTDSYLRDVSMPIGTADTKLPADSTTMPNILDVKAEPFLEVFSFLGWVQKSHKHDHLVVIQGFQRFLFMISNGKVNDSHEVILNFIVKS